MPKHNTAEMKVKPRESQQYPRGHQARIARNLGVSETAVSLVLAGKSSSRRILAEHQRLLREYELEAGRSK